MIAGIMQPYFFPYLGHFALIAAVDEWIVFDVTQYTPKTWMNRNRILHPNEGWQYTSIPLFNSSNSIKTYEAKILDIKKAKNSVLGKISHYKKQAPYFYQVQEIIQNAFDLMDDDALVNLNINSLKLVCEYLDIPFNYRKATELRSSYPEAMAPGDWAPLICSEIGAAEYINPLSGKEIFNLASFDDINTDLYFMDFSCFEYETGRYQFQPSLSILDVMMWNSSNTIIEKIKEGTQIIKAS